MEHLVHLYLILFCSFYLSCWFYASFPMLLYLLWLNFFNFKLLPFNNLEVIYCFSSLNYYPRNYNMHPFRILLLPLYNKRILEHFNYFTLILSFILLLKSKIPSKYHLNQIWVRLKVWFILKQNLSPAVNLGNQTNYVLPK